ncbi:hypothetical protein [Streptomyces sp. DH10]|uniref:hypothetical protein n=1 Tax=Streptomyces sp. DH10 TaxID=3040121 RepID=UPI0024434550|nr:hypothetical protein [Streptomyces sp. DH10]MDG9710477.1 hypothetical protein [Streptomyces sp. DH10]
MSGPPARASVPAAWSLQGKAPGQVAYDVQAGSVQPRIAQKYFWAASTETPRADRTHAPDALPWVAFLGSIEAGGPVTGLVETTWSGGRDATGRISYSARLLLLDWQPTSDAELTWSSLYTAALDTEWPTMDSEVGHPPHIVLDAAPTMVAKLARYIENDIGFEWAARSAALLLEGRHVAITLPPEHAGLSAVTRVAVLDGICALLPYGSRAWLSAATWAGHGADHELRLTFALRPRGSQCHAVLAGQPPQEPGTSQGRAYLAELLRLRRKKGTEAVLTHLLSHRTPLTAHDSEQALRHLQDLDLPAVVMGGIERGTSLLRDVARLLSRNPLESLTEPDAATVARHLARCTLPGGGSEEEREQARSLLLEHWSPRAGQALADELNSWPVESQTPQRVRSVLHLAAAAAPLDGQAHTAVLTGYLDGGTAAGTPDDLRSRSALLQAMQQELDENSAAAVHAVLVRRPQLTLAWLDVNAERNTLDDRLVRELLSRPGTVSEPNAPDWLRGAALIHREAPAGSPDRKSIEAFAAISETAWRTGLHLACHVGNPDVLAWLHPELYDVAAGRSGTDEDRGFLFRRVDVLVPRQRGLAGNHAAWADLLQLHLLGRDLPRSRLLADDDEAAAAYAGVLSRHLPSVWPRGWEEAVASGLVGERLDRIPYAILWELTHPQDVPDAGDLVALEGPLLNRVAELLTHAGDWITPGMPAPWEHLLRNRSDLQWLAHTAEIRKLVTARTAAPKELADAIVRASPNSRYAKRVQQAVEFPSAVVEAITPWLQDYAGRGDSLHRLAGHLNHAAPQQALGDLLYQSISQLRFGDLVRQRALDGHQQLKDSVEQAIRILRQKPSSRRQPTAPAPLHGQGGPGGTDRPESPPGAPWSSDDPPYSDPTRPVPGTHSEPYRGTKSRLSWPWGRGDDRL